MESIQRENFLEAYEKYADAIYKYCYFRVFSKERAEELLQETFMKMWQYISNGQKVDNMRAFAYRTATNLIIDDSRKKREESLDAALEKSDAFEPSYDGTKKIESGIALKEVIHFLENLDAEERQVLTMRYLEDLDPKEIGEIMGISSNNVSVRIHRALANLRKQFHKE